MGPFLHHCNTNGHLALNFESHSLQNKGLLGTIKQQSCEGTLSLNRNQGYSQEKGGGGGGGAANKPKKWKRAIKFEVLKHQSISMKKDWINA